MILSQRSCVKVIHYEVSVLFDINQKFRTLKINQTNMRQVINELSFIEFPSFANRTFSVRIRRKWATCRGTPYIYIYRIFNRSAPLFPCTCIRRTCFTYILLQLVSLLLRWSRKRKKQQRYRRVTEQRQTLILRARLATDKFHLSVSVFLDIVKLVTARDPAVRTSRREKYAKQFPSIRRAPIADLLASEHALAFRRRVLGFCSKINLLYLREYEVALPCFRRVV